MTDSSSKDAIAKQRIITHMNADHQDSLVRYLEYYCHVSSYSARSARLEDISFNSLTLKSSPNGGSIYTIPIDPPMISWSEARERVVAMDAEAVAGLERSNITVKKYKRPKGFKALVFVAAACSFVVFSKRSNFQPGSLFYDAVLRHVPAFAEWCYKIQPMVIYPMIVIHSGEAAYMVQSRLDKHTVPRFSKLWWKWVLSTFVEGFGAFVRFDQIVKGEDERRAKVKH